MALQRRTAPQRTGSLRLGAGRSQVQILSPPYAKALGIQGFLSCGEAGETGHGVLAAAQDGFVSGLNEVLLMGAGLSLAGAVLN